MTLPVYYNFEEFKNNFESAFNDYESSYLIFLREYSAIYSIAISEFEDLITAIRENKPDILYNFEKGQYQEFKYKVANHYLQTMYKFMMNPLLFGSIKEQQKENAEYEASRYFIEAAKIEEFLEHEIDRERINIRIWSEHQKNGIDTLRETNLLIEEKEINKIRLLHETGVIKFLQDKYGDNTSIRKIAGFFELISEKRMIAKNNNSLFTTDSSNSKYPNKGMTL
ncbi:hypothetical protein HZR02_16800 [Elizabethkingia anophelis]|nr:hypothetical protein [Elizabethkingia anophelis]MCT3660544.1 hypothetical protein [Elizabethkingia anophelis]MCT3667710.1 hypothetical protein [Elizabethkingia anophelis]MCT3853619.1 hypothetical protein [Elizabethkingia anophelis]MCT3864432.1 hypothetical protein [Elizabethkingia anophelis]